MPALTAVLGYWFLAHRGAVGIWIGLALGLGAAACGLLWRFHLRTVKAAIPQIAAT